MKLLLTLVVVAAVLNGAYQMGMDEYRYSQFKDSVHSRLTLGKDTPVEELKQQMLQKAVELRLPVTEDKVTVSREGVRTSIAVSYSSEPEPFPGYKYPRDHSFTDEIAAIK
jgi:hypothetical protein